VKTLLPLLAPTRMAPPPLPTTWTVPVVDCTVVMSLLPRPERVVVPGLLVIVYILPELPLATTLTLFTPL
jgi:hypothetical protein